MAFITNYMPQHLGLGSHNRICQPNRCHITMKRKDRAAGKPKQSKPQGRPTAEGKIPLSTETGLLDDIKKMRAKNANVAKEGRNSMDKLKSAIETILIWDFFVVLGFLFWFAVALVPHFASKNDMLLDPWLALWQPLIQPVLGFLMLGTVVQGTISFIVKK